MTSRRLHRITGALLAIFIAVHLINHLAIWVSPAAHLAIMDALRPFYRPVWIEIPLLAAVFVQIGLGLRLSLRRPWPRRGWPIAQRVSGLILALFLIQHILAALATRSLMPQIDTNIYWAAAVVSAPPLVWYFAPYYFLGIASVFTHIAALLARHPGSRPFAKWIVAAGVIFASVIVLGLIGPIEFPAPYRAYIQNHWGLQ